MLVEMYCGGFCSLTPSFDCGDTSSLCGTSLSWQEWKQVVVQSENEVNKCQLASYVHSTAAKF